MPLDIDPTAWNKLRVDFDGDALTVYVNGVQKYSWRDTDRALMEGKIALRTFDGGASFSHLTVDGEEVVLTSAATGVSDMWMPLGHATYTHDATTAAHGTYSQLISGSAGDGIFNRGLNKWGIGVDAATPMQ